MCGNIPIFIAIILIADVLQISVSVKINKLQVPEVIRHGAPVVLDCEFTLEATDEDLVLKWYFNKNRTLIYQWIPGSSRPQDLNVLKGRLNLDYKASLDANSAHRALHILEPGPDLSGDYTCSVSTLQSEDIRTKSMLVFVPEKTLVLRRIAADGELMKVQCKAEGVFPRPEMLLNCEESEILETKVMIQERGRLFDITATVTTVQTIDAEEFTCILKIPQANYTKKQEIVIFPGSTTNNFSRIWWLYIIPVLLLAES